MVKCVIKIFNIRKEYNFFLNILFIKILVLNLNCYIVRKIDKTLYQPIEKKIFL